ncbi:MAG: nitrogenase-stabilizing/protective protein NifW [gamma proteobacterium symbiont of Bathyaustriella thionipta]|nr:nitrogenase-stabilizing/protective protein NifW [gamma proteobacterium symbiont of Bathyaustriella thionipta]MCU7950234.1 nitrogenase-stabilizing/protective protein NifW [gamma proteobacterium symbiont of Bathyaustriella thionipta]MCU7952170.1 nitrogenase-stabilizing/protective protein NifW [gamma proteobacterium symbiont of Bathyaustriella thionipta]MCU7956769.1 nitrogenase-stabilizing/protective protein NifW [gamma proteobacterium symbiont of Bathyaustriella thionipta]MCU7968899.1 nitrogen
MVENTIDNESEFDLDMDELSSAEDFLNYFEIDYDQSIVHVNRLHILQRFHDYLSKVGDIPDEDEARRSIYAEMLSKAYNDFVGSDAQTEKVFKVFSMGEPSVVTIPLSDIDLKGTSSAPTI